MTLHRQQRKASKSSTASPSTSEIEASLQQAREMLDWGENWDGEGRPGYSEDTWSRAREFLLHSTEELWKRHQRAIPVPDIEPGPSGSIDFHWHMDDRELLLNLPGDPNELVDFYGDSSVGESIKGRTHPSTVGPWLLAWLTR